MNDTNDARNGEPTDWRSRELADVWIGMTMPTTTPNTTASMGTS